VDTRSTRYRNRNIQGTNYAERFQQVILSRLTRQSRFMIFENLGAALALE
jgi:hypothetical protein